VVIDFGEHFQVTVTQEPCHHIGVDALGDPECSPCVPIGYNKDKRRNLVIAMGFGFVLILFPLKMPLKTGFEIGGDNRGCYIKDKNIWEILEESLWHTIQK